MIGAPELEGLPNGDLASASASGAALNTDPGAARTPSTTWSDAVTTVGGTAFPSPVNTIVPAAAGYVLTAVVVSSMNATTAKTKIETKRATTTNTSTVLTIHHNGALCV